MADKKYTVIRAFADERGMHRVGRVVVLTDTEARYYLKLKAVELYLPDEGEDEAEEDAPAKPTETRRTRVKPVGGPVPFDDADALIPDPKAR